MSRSRRLSSASPLCSLVKRCPDNSICVQHKLSSVLLVSLLSHGSVLFVQKLKRNNLFLWFDLYLQSFMFTTSLTCQLIFMKMCWFHPSWLCLICSMRQGPNYWIQILSWLKIITASTIFTSTGPLLENISWASHSFKKRKMKWDLLLPSSNHFYSVSFNELYLIYQCLIFVTKFRVDELCFLTLRYGATQNLPEDRINKSQPLSENILLKNWKFRSLSRLSEYFSTDVCGINVDGVVQ